MTNPAHLSGLGTVKTNYRDPKLLATYHDMQKRMPTLTPLATARGKLTATQLNRRAVSGQFSAAL